MIMNDLIQIGHTFLKESKGDMMFKHEKKLFHPVAEEAHNAMFREAFNKVQNTGSDRDFGTTKAARMYFSMSEPSPQNSRFPDVNVTPPSFGA